MAEHNEPGHAPLFFPPVQDSEEGQKLLQFLERRLHLQPNLLHRWVRTGQIRVNGRRCKPFVRLVAGDIVRLPPFARTLAGLGDMPDSGDIPPDSRQEYPFEVIGAYRHVIAINKPAGLAAQPGTGHEKSVSSLLAAQYADAVFKPTPCHRLDRDTSGIMLIAESFSALRAVQEALRTTSLHKEYLAWVHGLWPWAAAKRITHYLRKEKSGDRAIMHVSDRPLPWAREAICLVNPLVVDHGKSLLQIRLFTGRTHQIRAQLAYLGYPVIGDGKYGQAYGCLYLHSLRAILPDGHEFACLPAWTEDYALTDLPPALCPNQSPADLAAL